MSFIQRLLILFALAGSSSGVLAQKYVYTKKTLLGEGVSGSAGCLGAGIRYGSFYSKPVFHVLINGGWNLTDRLVLGAQASQMISKVELPYNYFDPLVLNMRWEQRIATIRFSYIHKTYELIHPVIGLGAGGGEIKAKILDKYTYQFYPASQSYFYHVEPYAEAELNVSKWCRASLGVSYLRALGQTNKRSVVALDKISGPAAYFNIRFGEF